MSENIKPVAHRVDYPAENSIGRKRFFGAAESSRMAIHKGDDGIVVDLYDQSAIEAARQESAAELADLRRQLAAANSKLSEADALIRKYSPMFQNIGYFGADKKLQDDLLAVRMCDGTKALNTLLAAKERETIERCAITAWAAGMEYHNKMYGMPADAREVGSAGAAAIRKLLQEPTPKQQG